MSETIAELKSEAFAVELVKAQGMWVEPYTAPRESGVAVDGDISPEDAAKLNRETVDFMMTTLSIARAALNQEPKQTEEAKDGGAALAWLAANNNCELSHQFPDIEEEGEWQVHRVTGNRNDREWTLIGRGLTPLEALLSAQGPRT